MSDHILNDAFQGAFELVGFYFAGQGYFAGTGKLFNNYTTSMTPSTVKRVIKCLSVRRACICRSKRLVIINIDIRIHNIISD